MGTTFDRGGAHYKRAPIQPIQFMAMTLTPEQFKGFCLGNIIKYAARFGHKDAEAAEAEKIAVYAEFLKEFCETEGDSD